MLLFDLTNNKTTNRRCKWNVMAEQRWKFVVFY